MGAPLARPTPRARIPSTPPAPRTDPVPFRRLPPPTCLHPRLACTQPFCFGARRSFNLPVITSRLKRELLPTWGAPRRCRFTVQPPPTPCKIQGKIQCKIPCKIPCKTFRAKDPVQDSWGNQPPPPPLLATASTPSVATAVRRRRPLPPPLSPVAPPPPIAAPSSPSHSPHACFCCCNFYPMHWSL